MKATEGTAFFYASDGVEVFLVLDFDGVFNPEFASGCYKKAYFSPNAKAKIPNRDYKPVIHRWDTYNDPYAPKSPKSFPIQWSKELMGNLDLLLQDNRIQVIWLTTWRDEMGDVMRLMNVTSAREMLYLPWGNEQQGHKNDQRFKSPALAEFLRGVNADETRNQIKMVWADDIVLNPNNVGYNPGVPVYTVGEENSLLIAPDKMYGMSRSEWTQMADFVQNALNS